LRRRRLGGREWNCTQQASMYDLAGVLGIFFMSPFILLLVFPSVKISVHARRTLHLLCTAHRLHVHGFGIGSIATAPCMPLGG